MWANSIKMYRYRNQFGDKLPNTKWLLLVCKADRDRFICAFVSRFSFLIWFWARLKLDFSFNFKWQKDAKPFLFSFSHAYTISTSMVSTISRDVVLFNLNAVLIIWKSWSGKETGFLLGISCMKGGSQLLLIHSQFRTQATIDIHFIIH